MMIYPQDVPFFSAPSEVVAMLTLRPEVWEQ